MGRLASVFKNIPYSKKIKNALKRKIILPITLAGLLMLQSAAGAFQPANGEFKVDPSSTEYSLHVETRQNTTEELAADTD